MADSSEHHLYEGTDSRVAELVAGVERFTDGHHSMGEVGDSEWRVIVKVFGYPTVMGRDGSTAVFRKKRSLELLTWLVLNPDRQRRSAARTALWEMDVMDSTFANVVSDMRRALGELAPGELVRDWCPPTYSDEIPLSRTVVTDAALLTGALSRFKTCGESADELLGLLSGMRDAPFAGTTYSWADLDGTTTRLVILAMDATITAARWGREHGRDDVVLASVGAGLRVMPGCEELLELQDEIARAHSRRVAVNVRL